MGLSELALALLTLLLTPGPTNTLMALAGAAQGWARAARLVPATLFAYLLVVLPLVLAGPWLSETAPLLRPLVSLASGLWVMVLALRLWRLPHKSDPAPVTWRALWLTTLLNPKGLIIGFVLLPGTPLTPRLALLAVIVVVAGLVWAAVGARITGRREGSVGQIPPLLRRVAGIWLGALSIGLMLNALPRL